MDAGEIVLAVVAALGGGLGTALVTQLSSRAREKRQEERSAWVERDLEARARRKLEEYAHWLRRILFKLGLTEGLEEGDIPPWPAYKTGDSDDGDK